ncbi:DUF4224 domain-containing protein [Pseudomonas sp. MOIL14HWK12:I2]|uniref:DUF4224 domain-containing protein n=1 Tax=Pseudomonas sp. MOIL14HWK12:I2 TaxID=1033994 RepID=UPI0015A6298B|nr:DUF4224 domain-containing protein [Pseudomonas sp. MOIL14HWK12:I2]
MTQHTTVLKLLTPAELAVLAGSTRSNTQAAWLLANGIPYLVGADGKVKVLAAEIYSRLSSERPARNVGEVVRVGSVSSLMTTELAPTDKLTEMQMADELGTSLKALQHRRYRGQIPEGVWMKHGRTIYYSLQRYDEWLESVWKPALPPQIRTELRPPKPRRNGSATYPLLR